MPHSLKLLPWYLENKRVLPWRKNRDPYPIWISEIMLQQTTVKAVIPYFNNFMERFPSVQDLAKAPESEVLEKWTGLGYYSRARNIHKAAKALASMSQFPNSYLELQELPGLGPYTSRAISSQAFGEQVGVVDGNVIRVYSRLNNDFELWWNRAAQIKIQTWANKQVHGVNPSDMNQALMELGSTVCTPKSPQCFLCPLQKECLAFKNKTQKELPIKKPKKEFQTWSWQALIYIKNKKIFLTRDHEAPFLKKQYCLPGQSKRLKDKPLKFDFKHSITCYKIFGSSRKVNSAPKAKGIWVLPTDVSKHAPFSLIQKTLQSLEL